MDPPWRFDDRGSRASPDWKHARNGYETLSLSEIAALPVDTIALPDAHLYLWCTDSHLHEALHLVEDWRFRYVHTLVWVKTTSSGRPALGMGHYYRRSSELCLFAVRGHAPARRHDFSNVILAPRRAHSAKPPLLHSLAERMSPGPRIELFARATRASWTCWGAQCPHTETEAVP
jgi:N6-adenosine-specific RNA methylase IME4